jgi:hypothetical protein
MGIQARGPSGMSRNESNSQATKLIGTSSGSHLVHKEASKVNAVLRLTTYLDGLALSPSQCQGWEQRGTTTDPQPTTTVSWWIPTLRNPERNFSRVFCCCHWVFSKNNYFLFIRF